VSDSGIHKSINVEAPTTHPYSFCAVRHQNPLGSFWESLTRGQRPRFAAVSRKDTGCPVRKRGSRCFLPDALFESEMANRSSIVAGHAGSNANLALRVGNPKTLGFFKTRLKYCYSEAFTNENPDGKAASRLICSPVMGWWNFRNWACRKYPPSPGRPGRFSRGWPVKPYRGSPTRGWPMDARWILI
jgi:hypothetical protein